MRTLRNRNTDDIARLLLRSIAGAVFTFHGAQKLFGLFGGPGVNGFASYLDSLGIPVPLAIAYLAARGEFCGGLALLAGVGVGLASVPLGITMLVACFALRAGGFDAQKGGFEFPLTLAVLTAAVGLLGSGRYTAREALARLRDKSQSLHLGSTEPSLH